MAIDQNKNISEENNELPEIYSIRKGSDQWDVSRRDFLKAASVGVAAVTAGITAVRRSDPVWAAEDLNILCKTAIAHQGLITALAVSPDGSQFVSADENRLLKLWSLPGGELIASAEVSAGVVHHLHFSSDSEYLFCGTEHGDILKYSVSGNLLLSDTDDSSLKITAMASSPAGKEFVVAREDGRLLVGDGNWMTFTNLDSDVPLRGLAYTSDGKHVVGGGDGNIFVYDVTERKRVNTIAIEGSITDLCILPGDVYVAIVTDSGEVGLWSLVTGKRQWSDWLRLGISPNMVLSTPDGSLVILKGKSQKILFYSVADGKELKEIAGVDGENRTLAVTPDGSTMLVGFGQTILIYSLPEGTLISCPIDLDELPDTVEGITMERVDEVTGKTVTFTLPCGSPIPAGAVCICNCVAGSVCSCVGYVACSCDGHVSCSCVGHTVTTTYHYWHPN